MIWTHFISGCFVSQRVHITRRHQVNIVLVVLLSHWAESSVFSHQALKHKVDRLLIKLVVGERVVADGGEAVQGRRDRLVRAAQRIVCLRVDSWLVRVRDLLKGWQILLIGGLIRRQRQAWRSLQALRHILQRLARLQAGFALLQGSDSARLLLLRQYRPALRKVYYSIACGHLLLYRLF